MSNDVVKDLLMQIKSVKGRRTMYKLVEVGYYVG